MIRVFIGFDPLEETAALVCERSLRDHASQPVMVEFLDQERLRLAGLYQRPFHAQEAQRYDSFDGRPFSTDFSFARFLVPALCQYRGDALYCDSDMLWREDIARLWNLRRWDLSASAKNLISFRNDVVQVVKHDYRPKEGTKMRGGLVQQAYERKNWSSLMLFNNEQCRHLTPALVNAAPGRYLHGFQWLDDSQIGALPAGWNHLEGHDTNDDPFVVHFTSGTPDVPGYEDSRFAKEWWAVYGAMSEAVV